MEHGTKCVNKHGHLNFIKWSFAVRLTYFGSGINYILPVVHYEPCFVFLSGVFNAEFVLSAVMRQEINYDAKTTL